MKIRLFGILLLLSLAFIMIGCGSSDSDRAPTLLTETEPSGVSVEKFIEAAEGGTLYCKVSDGTVVRLDIPPKALAESMTIKLKVTLASESEDAGTDSLYMISTQPDSVKLFNPARLTVRPVPAIENNTGLFVVMENDILLPLKQAAADDQVKGNIYTLGLYDFSRFDTGKCIEIFSEIETSDAPENWQDLITVFNSLIWIGTYFQSADEADDAKACMDASIDICGEGIEKFIARSVSNDEKALPAYKNALEKYKYIQKLCADQEILSKNIDDK